MSDLREDINMLNEALGLERKAIGRYIRHISLINDPRINATLEGFRRNEAGHKGEIEELMGRLEKAG